jgi:hypothetical protein
MAHYALSVWTSIAGETPEVNGGPRANTGDCKAERSLEPGLEIAGFSIHEDRFLE